MSNMNEGANKDRRRTIAEREHSPCTKSKERKSIPSGRYWEGMNDRDETDECSYKPVGLGIADGFRMSDPDYDG